MSEKEQYKFNEIPKEFEVELFTHYCYHSPYSLAIGRIVHSVSDLTGDEYLCIASTLVKVHVPEQKTDIKKLVIAALEAEKQKQLAEHHKRMFELREKIDSLLQLEYHPAGE